MDPNDKSPMKKTATENKKYNSKDASGNGATLSNGKKKMVKHSNYPVCATCELIDSDEESSQDSEDSSQSPPSSHHRSLSASPVSKEMELLNDIDQIESPDSSNSSLASSPCRETALDDLATKSDCRDSQSKSSEVKSDDQRTDVSHTSPHSSSEKRSYGGMLPEPECDCFKSHIPFEDYVDNDSSSSESRFSYPRHSIEDWIKELDERFNAWARTFNTTSSLTSNVSPSSLPDLSSNLTFQRLRLNYRPPTIVKAFIPNSTIFDQDSKRLQNIDEKYEPLNFKMDLSPKVKQTFQTKAAPNEFSTPITPSIQTFNQSRLAKSPATVIVAQRISPPATPESGTCSIFAPVSPPVLQITQLPPNVYAPCSPLSTSFGLTTTILENPETLTSPLDKDLSDPIPKSPQEFNNVKDKVDMDFHANATALATLLTSSTSPETQSNNLIVTSLPLKKGPTSRTKTVTENVDKVSVKTDLINSTSIPIKKESSLLSVAQDHSHLNCIDQDIKEFNDSKDSILSFGDEVGHLRENEEIKVCADSSAKLYPCSVVTEHASVCGGKKRVSSIIESDSSISVHPEEFVQKLSHEPNRDDHENCWTKQENFCEPEAKKPKLCKRERSPVHPNSN